jgi:hypothetical protein
MTVIKILIETWRAPVPRLSPNIAWGSFVDELEGRRSRRPGY